MVLSDAAAANLRYIPPRRQDIKCEAQKACVPRDFRSSFLVSERLTREIPVQRCSVGPGMPSRGRDHTGLFCQLLCNG